MSEIFGRLGGPRDDDGDSADEIAGGMLPDAMAGRWLRRHVAGGVIALTTPVADTFRAATLTGVMVASLDPLLFLISVESGSQMEGWIQESRVFGVSILGVRQQFLADQFAGFAPLASPGFLGIDHFTAITGSPLLAQSIGWADCRVADVLDTGDHVCFLGHVVASGRGEGHTDDPLLYYVSRYLRPR